MQKVILTMMITLIAALLCQCNTPASEASETALTIDYTLTADQTHDKFSSAIAPVLRVKSGSVIEAFTHEATGGQLSIHSTLEEYQTIDRSKIHTLTGPVYVENAEPGDILAVKLHKIELDSWGWQAIVPRIALLRDEFDEYSFVTHKIDKQAKTATFGNRFTIPLKPFPGVMGVAPATEEMLSTGPPRANGGNMDDPNLVEGTTVYFPVFVKGALFSIGDPHAVQGLGEVAGTAIESPLRIIYEISLIKSDRKIEEPQYETDEVYAVTAFATTLDEAAKKATGYMVDHLAATYKMTREDAYMLCSLIGDLKIAEVVDLPHVLVTMHVPKSVLASDKMQ